MKNVHLAKAQTTFQDALQQRRPLEAFRMAGHHIDHQHFLYRRQVFLAVRGRLGRGAFLDRSEQGRYRLLAVQLQVALAGLDTTAFVDVLGAERRQVLLVEGRFLVTLDHAYRAEQVGIDRFVIRQFTQAAVKLELELALAATHTSPAVEQDAGNHHDTDDNQPFTQAKIHVRHYPRKKMKRALSGALTPPHRTIRMLPEATATRCSAWRF